MAKTDWEITGQLRVEEDLINGVEIQRELEGVEVEVFASDLGVYKSWGRVRTFSDGRFKVTQKRNKAKRKIRIMVRFDGPDLAINAGLLGKSGDFLSPWIEAHEDVHEVEDSTREINPTFAFGANGELGDRDYVRSAISWYVCTKLIDKFRARDRYLRFKDKIRVIYPADVIPSKQCYANGITRCAYIHSTKNRDLWSVNTVIHEVMHLWNYDHNHGTSSWLGAVLCPPDFNTHGEVEHRPIAFHEGFAAFAAKALLHELWGDDDKYEKPKPASPYSRYGLYHTLNLRTKDAVEKNDLGVYRALALLAMDGLFEHEFGDNRKPDSQSDDPQFPKKSRKSAGMDCPREPKVSIWDVLGVFEADEDTKWKTDWQVGNKDYGVRLFFERAADLLKLEDDTLKLLLSLIDPNATDEPQDLCESRTATRV